MTPIIIPISGEGGPSGPLSPWASLGVGFVIAIIGLMLLAMLWDTRDVLYDGDGDIAGFIVMACIGLLSLGLFLAGIVFTLIGAWGVIF